MKSALKHHSVMSLGESCLYPEHGGCNRATCARLMRSCTSQRETQKQITVCRGDESIDSTIGIIK